jgi:hypothetical protein
MKYKHTVALLFIKYYLLHLKSIAYMLSSFVVARFATMPNTVIYCTFADYIISYCTDAYFLNWYDIFSQIANHMRGSDFAI